MGKAYKMGRLSMITTSPPACHSIVAQNMHVKGAASQKPWKRGEIYKMGA